MRHFVTALILLSGAGPQMIAAQAAPQATPAQMPSVTLPAELDRVLRDYETAWRASDHERLAQLFTEDGFILPGGNTPIRGRAAIAAYYKGQSGPLHLRALAYTTADSVGYIIGAYGYGNAAPVPDGGKFTLTLRRVGGRWLIASDMDNSNRRPGSGPTPPANMTLHPAADMQWKEGPASLPKGAQMMVLEGDPGQPGPFTLRFKFPKGFQIQPHFHTQTEHATVLAGTIHLGMGDKFDRAALKPLAAGSFGFWPAGTRHYALAETETILQLHGQGPWTIEYVNPADDPRGPRP